MGNEATKKDLADLEKSVGVDIKEVAEDVRAMDVVVKSDHKTIEGLCDSSNRHETENREADKRFYAHDKSIVDLKQQVYALQVAVAELKKHG